MDLEGNIKLSCGSDMSSDAINDFTKQFLSIPIKIRAGDSNRKESELVVTREIYRNNIEYSISEVGNRSMVYDTSSIGEKGGYISETFLNSFSSRITITNPFGNSFHFKSL